MFKKEENNTNFWISYADLMAGLLFVFILLIGAIVTKSIILRSNLTQKEKKLQLATKELRQKEKILEENRARLKKLEQDLKDKQRALLSGNNKISNQSLIIARQKRQLQEAKEQIKLQKEEVQKLHILLAQLQTQNQKLKEKFNITKTKLKDIEKNSSNLIALYKNRLELKEKDLKKLNQLLIARNTKIDELNKKVIILQNLVQKNKNYKRNISDKLQEYENRVFILSKELTQKEDALKLKDKKLTQLLEALDNQKSKYESLLEKLRKQRAKIKSLTGIKLKVIDELKQTLGDKIAVDKSGALRLSSKILFDKNSAKLKEKAKKELREVFEKYITSLMNNRAIAPYIDRIIIEGHTDSDGGYLYNLKLSQQRALAVMNYLLSLPISKKYNLKKYLVASGRSYIDRIIKNGKEDKEASRRIEIKFSLKNQEAMSEIEKILSQPF
jgi:chemotaxis protein MotB